MKVTVFLLKIIKKTKLNAGPLWRHSNRGARSGSLKFNIDVGRYGGLLMPASVIHLNVLCGRGEVSYEMKEILPQPRFVRYSSVPFVIEGKRNKTNKMFFDC